jgi:thioredoxin reductase (NADPH)
MSFSEEESVSVRKVVIIGSGPAGLTAAIYAARANLKPVIIEGDPGSRTEPPGGQLMLTTEVENYPGFPEGVQGPELMDRFKKQAARFGAEFISGKAIHAVKGKKVVVVGGGDTAMEEANFLTRYAERVYVVHRRDEFRASKIMLKRAQDNPKIEFKLNRTVADIIPEKRFLGSLVLAGTNADEGKKEDLPIGPAGGLFIAIGHSPNVDIFKGQLELEENGYMRVKGWSSLTSVEGVFAAGDVHDHHYRQAVTAAGAGCKAAIDAERWLEGQGL